MRDHLGEKVNVYFKETSFGSGDLVPVLSKIYEKFKADGKLPKGNELQVLTWIAANEAVSKAKDYEIDMKGIFLHPEKELMKEVDRHLFKTGCKFGSKELQFGQFHHGIQRSYMKYLEGFNQDSDINIFEPIKESLYQ